MLISGHKTSSMLERYNIISLKNLQDAGPSWTIGRRADANEAKKEPRTVVPIRNKRVRSA